MSKIDNNYSLNDSDNYLSSEHNISENLKHHLKIINEFTHNIVENNITNSSNKLLIILKGIESLFHIYNYLFYYTKNPNLCFYHTQKAIYMYIEFIKQISDEQNNLLNLKINDAVIFIYKKTIFDIKKEFIKNKENNINEILNINSKIIKYVFSFLYNKSREDLLTNLKPIINLLENIYSFNYNENNFSNLLLFLEILFTHFLHFNNEQYIESIDKFSRKINKNSISTKYMKEKIYFVNNSFQNLTPNQIIQMIFN
jgi:hypothetical protein